MSKIKVKLKKIKEIVLSTFFPRTCFGCDKEGKYICDKCQVFIGEASLICPVCEKPSFAGQKHQECSTRNQLDGLVGIWEYEGILKEALFKIKYWSNFDAIPEFIKKTFLVMRRDLPRFENFLSFLFSEDVYIAYVPMFRKKKRRRGFNQSEKIAQSLGKISKKETISLLEKIKDTESQTQLNREERIENVKDSFRVLPDLSFIPKKVVLVDDLWTTGSTMKECAKILKIGGVEKVWGFALFRNV